MSTLSKKQGERWGLRGPSSAASKVATPLHGEIAPFRLISPPMKFPPQAVIGGSSPPRFFLKFLRNFRAEKPQGRKISFSRLRSLQKFSLLPAYMPPVRMIVKGSAP